MAYHSCYKSSKSAFAVRTESNSLDLCYMCHQHSVLYIQYVCNYCTVMQSKALCLVVTYASIHVKLYSKYNVHMYMYMYRGRGKGGLRREEDREGRGGEWN